MSNRSSHHIMFCVVCTSLFPLFAIASLCDDSKKFLSSFTPSISSVAHRGYKIHGAVENTAEAYRYAREAGFQYGETDIQWTKDDIPVCCHDKFFSTILPGTASQLSNTHLKSCVASIIMVPPFPHSRR